MKKRLLYVLIVVFMLAALTYFYVNNFFLPINFKQFVTTKAEETINRKVRIDAINFDFFKGFVINDIKVYETIEGKTLFLEIEEARFNILYPNIFKNKTIIVPSIKIVNPYLHLIYHEDKSFNISSLIQKGSQKSEMNPFNLIVQKLSITGGIINFDDFTQDVDFKEMIHNVNCEIKLSLKQSANITFDALIPKYQSNLRLNGNYSLSSKTFSGTAFVSNLAITEYLSRVNPQATTVLTNGFLKSSEFNVKHEKDALTLNGYWTINDLRIKNNNNHLSAQTHLKKTTIKWEDNKLQLNGEARFDDLVLKSPTQSLTSQLALDIDNFTYANNEFSLKGQISGQNSRLSLDKNQSAAGELFAREFSIEKTAQGLKIRGDIQLDQASISLVDDQSIKGNILAINSTITHSKDTWRVNTELAIEQAVLKLKNDMTYKGQINAPNLMASISKNSFSVSSDLDLPNSIFKGSNNLTYTGNPTGAVNINKIFEDQSPIAYSATLNFGNDTIENVPNFKRISNIRGPILLERNALILNNLSLITNDITFSVDGKVYNPFAEATADVNINSKNFKMSKLFTYIPTLKEKLKSDIKGLTDIEMQYKGLLNTPQEANIVVNASLKDVTIKPNALKDAIRVSTGKIRYLHNEKSTWENIKASYKDETYTLTGELINTLRPTVSTSIVTENINLQTQWKISKGMADIIALKGSLFSSKIDGNGSIHFAPNTDPIVNFIGEINLNLTNLSQLFPKMSSQINALTPTGDLAVKGEINGPIAHWRKWKLNLLAQSPKISIKGYSFNNAIINLNQENLKIDQLSATAKLYGGDFSFKSNADLSLNSIPFKSVTQIDELNLAEYQYEKKTKNTMLSGTLNSVVGLTGSLTDTSTFKGEGSLDILDGFLGQLVPEFKNTYFTSVKSSFIINQSKVRTDNTKIFSRTATLSIRGWLDFNSNIDFQVVPTFSEAPIIKSGTLKIDPTALLTRAVNIRLTGTLKEPKKEIDTSPSKVITNTTGILREGIGNILQDLLK